MSSEGGVFGVDDSGAWVEVGEAAEGIGEVEAVFVAGFFEGFFHAHCAGSGEAGLDC